MGALALFAHLMADTIVNGSATSHLAPTDHADRECRAWMQQVLGGGFMLLGLVFGVAVPKPLPPGAGYRADLYRG